MDFVTVTYICFEVEGKTLEIAISLLVKGVRVVIVIQDVKVENGRRSETRLWNKEKSSVDFTDIVAISARMVFTNWKADNGTAIDTIPISKDQALVDSYKGSVAVRITHYGVVVSVLSSSKETTLVSH